MPRILSNTLNSLVVLVVKGSPSEIVVMLVGYYLKQRLDTTLNLRPNPSIKYDILACRVLA